MKSPQLLFQPRPNLGPSASFCLASAARLLLWRRRATSRRRHADARDPSRPRPVGHRTPAPVREPPLAAGGSPSPGPGTDPVFDSWADSVLSTLTLEEKAGQLIMPWVLGDFAPEGSASRERISEMVEELGSGGSSYPWDLPPKWR